MEPSTGVLGLSGPLSALSGVLFALLLLLALRADRSRSEQAAYGLMVVSSACSWFFHRGGGLGFAAAAGFCTLSALVLLLRALATLQRQRSGGAL